MSTLLEIQRDFVNSLISPEFVSVHIQNSEHMTAQQHIEIYRSSIFGTLQKNLKEIYPVCCKLVGEEFFIGMTNQFLTLPFAHSPDLIEHGAEFADFIANFEPAKVLPYLADVAKLEWSWHRIFYASDNSSFDFEALQKCMATDGERLIFLLPNSSSILSSKYPIHQIWEANQENLIGDENIILTDDKFYYFLVWRCGIELRIELLNEAEWQILRCIEQKLTLSEMLEQLESAINFAQILPDLIRKNLIVGFCLKNI